MEMKKRCFALILCMMMLLSACSAPTGSGTPEPGAPAPGGSEETLPPAQTPSDRSEPPADIPSDGGEVLPDPGKRDPADIDSDERAEVDSGAPDASAPDGGADVSAPGAEPDAPAAAPDSSGGITPPEDEDPVQEPAGEGSGEVQPPEQPEPLVFPEIELNAIPAVSIVTRPDATITRDEYIDCAVAVMDPTGTYDTVSDMEATIKVRGHSSSQGAKKPYNFKFSSKQELLGLGKGKKWALLANMYDKTQLRNLLAFEFARDIGMPYIQQSTFVEVYLNGEYRGLYQLCEPVDVDETKVDIDKDGNEALLEIEPRAGYSNDNWMRSPHYRLLLGFNEPEEPTDEQRAYYKEFLGAAEKAMDSGDYAEVCKYVDVDSFANAYIVQELFKQVDYKTTSTRFYIKQGRLYEGPVWDFDLSSGNCSESRYPEYNNKDTTGLSWQGIYCVGLWNQHLFEYDEFRQLVSDRLTQLQSVIVNLCQDNELGRSRIDRWLDEYRAEIDRNNGLWSTKKKANAFEHTPVDGTYDGEIEFLRDWLSNRNQWLLDYYCAGE